MWFSHQNMSIDDDNNAYSTIIANILEVCKNGCTKDKIIHETHLSHDQLRRITAVMVDRELLHYIEGRSAYITTDKGYIFLNNRKQQQQSNALDNKIKTKEELLLNSIASKQNIIHRKIQLWTNKHQNEFAIKLTGNSAISISGDDNDGSSNIFLASTNPKEDYIAVVAETDYFGDLKHGWEYTLSHLVEQYKQEIRNISLRSAAKNQTNNKKEVNNKSIYIRLIPYIKCRYCNSEFLTEKEKKEHELEWHV